MGVATVRQTLSRVFSAMAAERAKKRRKLVLTPVNHSHPDGDQKRISAPTLALPEQECTLDDTLSEVLCVPLSLLSLTRL